MHKDVIKELLSHIIDDVRVFFQPNYLDHYPHFDDSFLYLGFCSHKDSENSISTVFRLVEKHVNQYPESLLHWIWWNSEDGHLDLSSRVYSVKEFGLGYDLIEEICPDEDFCLANSAAQVMYKELLLQAEAEYLATLQSISDNNRIENEELKATFDNLVGLTFSYRSSKKFFEFMKFNVKLKNYSPFNVALIYTQYPGAEYVATQKDWTRLHNRKVAQEAKPIIILAPFHPILMVFDIKDTTGDPLPERCFSTFWAAGYLPTKELNILEVFLSKFEVKISYKQLKTTEAGYIKKYIAKPNNDITKQKPEKFSLIINDSHNYIVKFATLVHEIGHLLCGHLGSVGDVKGRETLTLSEREFEAESISYIVCSRLGISTNSDEYLSGYVQNETFIPKNVSVDLILKVASKIEQVVKASKAKPKQNDVTTEINNDENVVGQISLFTDTEIS